MHSGKYKFNFSDEVRIKIGSAVQNKSKSQWKSGSKVGKHEINEALYNKLEAALGNEFTFDISAKSIGPLHKMKATDSKTGKTVNGVYDKRRKEFVFGSAKGKKAKGGAGSTQLGIIKGKIDLETGAITNGKFDIGFIAGKAPLLISAGAMFTFTGNKV